MTVSRTQRVVVIGATVAATAALMVAFSAAAAAVTAAAGGGLLIKWAGVAAALAVQTAGYGFINYLGRNTAGDRTRLRRGQGFEISLTRIIGTFLGLATGFSVGDAFLGPLPEAAGKLWDQAGLITGCSLISGGLSLPEFARGIRQRVLHNRWHAGLDRH